MDLKTAQKELQKTSKQKTYFDCTMLFNTLTSKQKEDLILNSKNKTKNNS